MKTINKNTCHYPAWLDNPEKWNSYFTRYSGQARVWQTKKAFTLVELIIVITILAILATIAFISFQNFTKDARDGNRITTLKNIETWLSLYTIKNNTYPDPENYVEILSWTILLIKQWIVWNDVSQKINLNKEVKDPKDKKNYIYSTTWNNKKYQLWTYLEENKLISYIPQITKTYANVDYTKRYFYTIWHKVWILLEDETQNPILKTETLTWINLSTNQIKPFKVYFSNDTQSWSITNSWTTLITRIVENQKTTQTIQTPTYKNCWITLHNQPKIFYTATTNLISCDNVSQTLTCKDWIWKNSENNTVDTSSLYENCSLEDVDWECWTSNITPTLIQPIDNLFTYWNPTSVTENAWNYTWSCEWVNLWTTANCQATRQYTISSSVIWINWSVSCTPTTVNHWSDVTCNASPSLNYQVNTWTWDCTWSATICTLSNVTSNKTVSVSFKSSEPTYALSNCPTVNSARNGTSPTKATILANINDYIWCDVSSKTWKIAWYTYTGTSLISENKMVLMVETTDTAWASTTQWWLYGTDLWTLANITWDPVSNNMHTNIVSRNWLDNTQKIVTQIWTNESDRAAQKCSAKWTGWYLPASEELNQLYCYSNRASIWHSYYWNVSLWSNCVLKWYPSTHIWALSNFDATYYFSSTESSSQLSRWKAFYNGQHINFYKYYGTAVRCVSRF
jgi:prepilin-type N-terminal cleavage/methylation domain-containing protein